MRTALRAIAWVAGAIAVLFIACQSYVALRLWWWVDHNPASTAFMRAELERKQAASPAARLKHQWVPYHKISTHLKRAIVVAEDDKFTDHEGFDWEAIQKALEKNERKGKVVAGGSTITQQLAKNLFLSGQRSFIRKAEEALITLMIEAIMDKRRILEIYLNVIEWGDGVFGAEAAARHYYGVPASQLDAEQSARLAAMVPRPRFYDRNRNAPWLARKTRIILERMPRAQLP
jgi:monofunctional biosynthetic peptidoglycan transglycosylase